MKPRDVEKLRKKLDQAKSKKAENEGAYKRAMKELKEQFDVSSLSQGKRLLTQLQDRTAKLKRKRDKKLESIEEKYDL